MALQFELNGEQVEVSDESSSLLDTLRDGFGVTSVKDGCSPQGQCGCCTVLVDGEPRVSCVTPLRRVAGRSVVTVEGLVPEQSDLWAQAFCDAGASQCGFCSPGIILRLEGARRKGANLAERTEVDKALAAHLCRCTGWQTIVEAAAMAVDGATCGDDASARDLEAASQRATLEGRSMQSVGPHVSLGRGGFADDTADHTAPVAVLDVVGEPVVGPTMSQARAAAGKVQGRRTTVDVRPPLGVPDGDWALTLQTSWVEPAYLEPDASWSEPGGTPASPLANGGAFGGKFTTPVLDTARRLADEHGTAVRVRWSREDVVRLGPKRPPMAIGVAADGSGVLRVAATPEIADRIALATTELRVQECEVAGPRTSADVRGAGWVEAAVVLAALHAEPDGSVEIVSPEGARATAVVREDEIAVTVRCGRPLDPVVLRSYCIGAAHMALGWVTSEGLAVDDDGAVLDLTIRSFGIVRPSEMVHVSVEIEHDDAEPVNGSDAVFAAVAAAVWVHQGCPLSWPTGRRLGAGSSR